MAYPPFTAVARSQEPRLKNFACPSTDNGIGKTSRAVTLEHKIFETKRQDPID
jgi:hypothetical protein